MEVEKKVDVIDLISTLLDAGKIKEALNVPNEEKFKEAFRDNCWDLITVVTEKIQDDTMTTKPSVYGACEQLLTVVVETCSPEEALLELIERVELAKNDAQFAIIVPALLQVMKKLTSKRGRSLEWCLNSITTYIENIPNPDSQLEGDERKLMDSDPNFRRITKVYSVLPFFYQYFIEEYYSSETPNIKTKEIITAFLINLLGKPVIYVDIDPKLNERSEARHICYTIIKDICKLEKNVLKFLFYVEVCSKEKQKPSSSSFDEEIEPYNDRDRINMTTLSGLFYMVYSGHFDLPAYSVPQVYNNDYIINCLLLTVNHLLTFTEYGPIMKALAVCDVVNTRLALRAGRRLLLPLASVPVNNTQRIIRKYSQKLEKETQVASAPGPSEHEEHQYEENVKNKILEGALDFVLKSGWSVESLSAGAKAAGYPSITHGLFPNGGGDLVHYFNVKCNEALVSQMKTWPKENQKDKVPAKFIENAIMTRLQMIEPYKSTWPKAMAIQTLPNNVPNCLATLLSLVDDICYHSGDRSVDFNWYVRRVGLAGIYKTAELFYLTDNSQGNSATRSYIASRIRDAQLIQSALDLNPVAAAPQTLSAAFVTAKNMLGINTLK